MRYKLISCEIFYREFQYLLPRSSNSIDVEFMQKGLHDIPTEEMVSRIQAKIDEASEQAYDAILLGYGLCNNGLVGITARSIPLVLPRSHDCIALFLGSRHRYRHYFDTHPGTFFRTTGWIERDKISDELRQLSIPSQTGMDMSFQELIEKYGEDNAQYLWETLCDTEKNYSQITFIEMGVEPDDSFEEMARKEARSRDFVFEKISGDLSLLQGLLEGEWNPEDYLIVPPHARIHPTYADETIVQARSVESSSE